MPKRRMMDGLMHRLLAKSLLAGVLVAAGCGGGATTSDGSQERMVPPHEAGWPDAGLADRTASERTKADAERSDGLVADTPGSDAGPHDSSRDAPGSDGARVDAPKPDASRIDAPRTDAPPLPPFRPAADTSLPAGSHAFSVVEIPAGVTVTAQGDLLLEVSGDLTINGSLRGDCTRIELRVGGSIAVQGTVDNNCPAASRRAADLVIRGRGGSLALGTASTAAIVQTSGNLEVTNNASLGEWEFDVLPGQRSSSKLPPVCSGGATTLVALVSGGHAAEIGFLGQGADPNGGEVSYQWDFGDGSSASEKNPAHTFATAGLFPVTLTVSDTDGELCHAGLHVAAWDPEPNSPPLAAPAVSIAPSRLVVEAGQEVIFTAKTWSQDPGRLGYAWSFGDGAQATQASPTHTYAAPGRYQISLSVSDLDGNTSQAAAVVYVAPPSPSPLRPANPDADCANPGSSVNVINVVSRRDVNPTSEPGKMGASSDFRVDGDVVVYGGTEVWAQSSGDWTDVATEKGLAGSPGGDTGLDVQGQVTLCDSIILVAGDGGDGQDSKGGQVVWGGYGGRGGRVNWRATGGFRYRLGSSDIVLLSPGSGGDGGDASASGKQGADGCPYGKAAEEVLAFAGDAGWGGGSLPTFATVPDQLALAGGNGGQGGNADAIAGKGGDATGCPSTAYGGPGGRGSAYGGHGGYAIVESALARFVSRGAFQAGNGGEAKATGGLGGSASAVGPACADARADGGAAGDARAAGGAGGQGHSDGSGGNATAVGLHGGSAAATAGSCSTDCGNGGNARAFGGMGLLAMAYGGEAKGAGGIEGRATASPASGGNATATAGNGGSCVATCTQKTGGTGGDAAASGGQGGKGDADGVVSGGSGGVATANAGNGAKGSVCCEPSPGPGGPGGKGGEASALSGRPGGPGGTQPTNAGKAGNGGQGGCGCMPGKPGAGGVGYNSSPVELPDGHQGADGEVCC